MYYFSILQANKSEYNQKIPMVSKSDESVYVVSTDVRIRQASSAEITHTFSLTCPHLTGS